MANICESVVSGTGSRWTLGSLILVQLLAYNETGGSATMLCFALAALYALLAGSCKSGIKSLQISYLRTTHRLDFFCLFLAKWMDILALFSACAILVRTLSSSLDAMTGGLARMYILGRNSAANEPWPDVIGVVVIFIVTGMFMLGLENTRIFGFLMVGGVISVILLVGIITVFTGTVSLFHTEPILPKGIAGLLSGTALSTFTYSNDLLTGNYIKRLLGMLVVFIILLSIELIGACCTMLLKFSTNHAYEAVPLLFILELKDFQKLIPAVACLLVLTCSGALLELFPEMFAHIVQLTTSDWKILSKQIGYESRESGSPTLTIFTGGSLCAMLAFACPLENLTYILAASHICATLLRSFLFLYSPFRPHYLEQQQSESSCLAYSRLSTGPPYANESSGRTGKKHIWCFRKPTNLCAATTNVFANHLLPGMRGAPISQTGNREENEREWLLLGEPSSPKAPNSSSMPSIVESSVLSDQVSDIECIALAKPENMDSEDSSATDIDAIVDEYRQKIKISTVGLMDRESLRLPTANSWYLAIIFIVLIVLGSVITAAGLMLLENIVIIVGVTVVLTPAVILWLFPRHDQTNTARPSVCIVTLLSSFILFAAVFALSWPALLLWFLAGLFLFIRCDTWCCLCLERPNSSGISSLAATALVTSRSSQGSLLHTRVACKS
ncbi:cationic amino acid transporter 3 [Anopheles bellator]|uniref:cationic amino acid transporter 3 n=1 Tax=Anopheles bellator TaxID=139047 RepID=UPI002648F444|nr:cationic amino acid transporter 3 [Anopheles bellator]